LPIRTRTLSARFALSAAALRPFADSQTHAWRRGSQLSQQRCVHFADSRRGTLSARFAIVAAALRPFADSQHGTRGAVVRNCRSSAASILPIRARQLSARFANCRSSLRHWPIRNTARVAPLVRNCRSKRCDQFADSQGTVRVATAGSADHARLRTALSATNGKKCPPVRKWLRR